MSFNPTWRQAFVWLALWFLLDIVVLVALPGELSWWAGQLVIVATGLVSASLVARFCQ